MKNELKKLTAVIVSITMFFATCKSVSAETQKSTNRPVIVNGAQYGVATYPMFGSDYGVKLRDAATMLNGTRLLFSQNWNGEKNSVFLERGPYQPVGGEMQLGGGSEKELTYSEDQF